MKRQLILTILFAINLSAFAEDTHKMDPKMAEMMRKYQAASTPGAEHKMLSGLAGKWKTISKMWHTADAKPEESKGNAVFKSILGGRWLQQEFKGKAMGQNFEGIGMIGYDNVKGKYVSMWIDSMSTSAVDGVGTFDTVAKTLKESGKFSCPMSSDKVQEYRSDWQMLDKNKMIYSMYVTDPVKGGPEYKMMEITYTR